MYCLLEDMPFPDHHVRLEALWECEIVHLSTIPGSTCINAASRKFEELGTKKV